MGHQTWPQSGHLIKGFRKKLRSIWGKNQNIYNDTLFIYFKILRWKQSSKEQHLYKTETFCNIVSVFTVTFDQHDEG